MITSSTKTPIESNNGMPVNIQDQHSKALDLKFIQALGAPTTLADDANPGDTTITLTSVAGFVDKDIIGIFCSTGIFYFGAQVGAPAASVITLDTPIDRTFSAATCTVIRATANMAVNGSATTQIFQIGPVGGNTAIDIDMTRFTGVLTDSRAMDDGTFGGNDALTYGIVLRQNNGVLTNLWNAKTNGDLALISASDLNYTDKAPSGENSARFRNSYAGPEKHGVTIRLEPGDILQLLVQDNLTGLTAFYMMGQGHVVTN